jgi:hypothetical protein
MVVVPVAVRARGIGDLKFQSAPEAPRGPGQSTPSSDGPTAQPLPDAPQPV